MLFNKTRQDNILILDRIIFFPWNEVDPEEGRKEGFLAGGGDGVGGGGGWVGAR